MRRVLTILAMLALAAPGAAAQPKAASSPPVTVPVHCPGVLTLDPHAPSVFKPPSRNVNLSWSEIWDGTLACFYADPGRMAYPIFELDSRSAKCRPLAPSTWYGTAGSKCDAGRDCTVVCDLP
jgi:hypothetical protein